MSDKLGFDLDLFKAGWRAVDSEGFEYDYVGICEKCSEYNRLVVSKIDSGSVTARSLDGKFDQRDASLLDLAHIVDETEYPIYTEDSQGNIVRWDSFVKATYVYPQEKVKSLVIQLPPHSNETFWMSRWKDHLDFNIPKDYSRWLGGNLELPPETRVDVILRNHRKLFNTPFEERE